MLDLSDIIVIACVAFSVGLIAGVWIHAGRVDRSDDPMAAPYGDVPETPIANSKSNNGDRHGL